MQPGPAMEARDGEAIVVDLTPPEVDRVHPRRSVWTALVIATFTAVTCAGLATSVVTPRSIDRAADRAGGPAPTTFAEALGQAHAPPRPRLDRTTSLAALPVVAGARVARGPGGRNVVHVTGAAAVTAGDVAVRLVMSGRVIARSVVVVDPMASIPGTGGRSPVGFAPWSTDLALPLAGTPGDPDAVLLVDVRWSASQGEPAGGLDLVVSLGDGRDTDGSGPP